MGGRVLSRRNVDGPSEELHGWGDPARGGVDLLQEVHRHRRGAPRGDRHQGASHSERVHSRDLRDVGAHVSDPFADGNLAVFVNKWDRDPGTGKVTYDFDVVVSGAAQVNGTCDGGCHLWIEGVTPNGTTEVVNHSFSGGGLYLGAPWTSTKSYAGTNASLPSFTSLRATLSPAAGGTRPKLVARAGVGTLTVGGYDFEYVVQFVAARNLDHAQVCSLVQDLTNETNIDPDSPTPPTKACWSAATVRGAIKAMAAVMGGIGVIKLIQYLTNGEGGGSIAQPKPGPAPEPDPYPEEPSPDPAPEPQPDPIGSGIQPPANCIADLAVRLALLRSLPDQDHHIATNKNRIADPKWTVQFEELLWEYFPDQSLSGLWNVIEKMRHRGPHPFAYHSWVYQNMLKALRDSKGNWAEFLRRWNAWVRDVINADPLIARKEYWQCYD